MSVTTSRARDLRNNPTEAEKKLWSKLRDNQLGVRFRRQHPIGPYFCDFYCPEKKIAIEADGGQHCENAYDQKRDSFLESQGVKVVRFWNNDILENLDGVIETILTQIPLSQPSPPQAGERARKDFPILKEGVHYLDTASSAQKPGAVIEAMTGVMEYHYANIHRGLYKFSQETTSAYEAVRAKVADFLNAPSENEIVFTRNTTEAINLVAQSWGRTFLKEGDEVILTEMEHHANIVPWQLLRDQIGIVIKIIPVLDDGTLDLDAYKNLLSDRTKFVGFVHISNSLGTINSAEEIIRTAKAYNPDIITLIDGSQSAVHGPVDVQGLGCDFFVCTGHKLYGPSGIGVLWGRYDLLDAMPPYQGGGDMIETVSFDQTTYKSPPARFEAGTPAIVEVIGLGAAIDYLSAIGMEEISAHEKILLESAMGTLQDIDGLTFYGTGQHKTGIISFTADWAHISDIAMILDQCGVYVRSGHHCCMPLMQRFGIDGTIRASFGLYSDQDDVAALVDGLHKAKRMLG